MSYVILDLEWNAAYSKSAHRFVNEIIEFGAVKLDDSLRVVDTFERLITPKVGKKLNGRVRELTKLTIEELSEGDTFFAVTKAFGDFVGDSVVMTWGTSDVHTLIDNYLYYTGDRRIPFLTRYCDLQEYCERAVDRFDEGNQLGLGSFAGLVGVSFSEEDQHRAASDALLSQKCLMAVADRLPLAQCVLDADCEAFYDRMMFKNHFITDLKSPEIDRAQMKFLCDRCGKQARRVKRWKLRNKNFNAEFCCRQCERKFIGRISFKKRYDGVKVNKRILEIPEKPKPQT